MSSKFFFDSSAENSKDAPSTTKDVYIMKPLLPQLPQPVKKNEAMDQYPGLALRPAAHPNDSLPSNATLIKTGGNALQAVDNSILKQDHLVAVTVPDKNLKPGDILVVLSPDGRQTVSARIPEGHGAGSVFFVNFAAPVVATGIRLSASAAVPIIVQAMDPSQPAEQDLELVEENAGENLNLGLVTVPALSKPGDKLLVQLPDQRVVEVIVPAGNVVEFYVQAPPRLAVTEQQQQQNLPGFVRS